MRRTEEDIALEKIMRERRDQNQDWAMRVIELGVPVQIIWIVGLIVGGASPFYWNEWAGTATVFWPLLTIPVVIVLGLHLQSRAEKLLSLATYLFASLPCCVLVIALTWHWVKVGLGH